VPAAWLRELCGYWRAGYDWRATEARLGRIPQFTTVIDGLAIHFLHVRSRRPGAVPLILTHGWPGSFLEFEAALGLLAAAEDGPAFDVVVPSAITGSSPPAATGARASRRRSPSSPPAGCSVSTSSRRWPGRTRRRSTT
jgi:pimeloyl-ACP methyl ester carboxylesterase